MFAICVVLSILLLIVQSYYLRPVNEKSNWYDAESYCVDTCKSHLTSIHSQSDFDNIKSILGSDGVQPSPELQVLEEIHGLD